MIRKELDISVEFSDGKYTLVSAQLVGERFKPTRDRDNSPVLQNSLPTGPQTHQRGVSERHCGDSARRYGIAVPNPRRSGFACAELAALRNRALRVNHGGRIFTSSSQQMARRTSPLTMAAGPGVTTEEITDAVAAYEKTHGSDEPIENWWWSKRR